MFFFCAARFRFSGTKKNAGPEKKNVAFFVTYLVCLGVVRTRLSLLKKQRPISRGLSNAWFLPSCAGRRFIYTTFRMFNQSTQVDGRYNVTAFYRGNPPYSTQVMRAIPICRATRLRPPYIGIPPYRGKPCYLLQVISAIPRSCQAILTAVYRDTALYRVTALLGDPYRMYEFLAAAALTVAFNISTGKSFSPTRDTRCNMVNLDF